MTKPISPKKVKKIISFPKEVITIFNDLITKHWNGSEAHFTQTEAVDLITKKLKISSQKIFDNHWLDVEPVYRQAGWIVEFDQPAYCESYEASFKFKKGSKIKKVVKAIIEIG